MRRFKVAAMVLVAALIFVGIAVVAFSQTNRGDGTPGVQVAQAPGQAGGDRAAQMQQMLQRLRERLVAAGATDADVQAIMAHMRKQREITAPLTEAMQGLRQASAEGATDDQAKQAVSNYEAAMKTVKEQLTKAEEDLKTQLNLATKPRLHAMLLTMGALDNGQGGRGGMMMGGMGGGGRGGRGGAARGPG